MAHWLQRTDRLVKGETTIASTRSVAVLVGMLSVTLTYAADKPGPFASSDKKLDYLLQTWGGRSLEALGAVWGRETSTRLRGDNQTYVYERISRARASVSIFGQASVSTDDIVCTASFEVDGDDTIVRVTRQGGGRECWNLFKSYQPPAE